MREEPTRLEKPQPAQKIEPNPNGLAQIAKGMLAMGGFRLDSSQERQTG